VAIPARYFPFLFSPISGYTTTLSRYSPPINHFRPPEREELRLFPGGNCASFRGRSSGFRRNRARWPCIPHAQLAVARLRSGVRPPARLRPAGGPAPPARGPRRGAALARAGPRPRPRSPWPASPGLAGHASPGTRRDAHLAGQVPRRTSAFAHACKRATGHINNRYHLHMITARPSPQYCFTGMDLYQSGSPPEGPDRPLPGNSPGVRVFQSQQVPGMEYGLAGGKERRPDCRDRRYMEAYSRGSVIGAGK
jgi:hypothetical protein